MPGRASKNLASVSGTTEKLGVYIETYGCQMNVNDSGIVGRILEKSGYALTDRIEEASCIFLNTCAVREKAHEKIYSRLDSLRHYRERNHTRIGILGCMAQNLSDDLLAQGLPIDIIAGPDAYRQLPQLIEQCKDAPAKNTRLSAQENYEDIAGGMVSPGGVTASVSIMRGCDNFCTFCVVPYTRGRERSSSPESIIREIQRLTAQGVKEVLLLGQNVNSYRSEGLDFCGLIARILSETDIRRIRFTSPHPHDFPVHLLELMATEERFCSQIHLPLQAGSSRVLGLMKRDYSRDEFLSLVRTIRSIVAGPGLSTDVIVGFPTETEADFQETLQVLEEIRFDMAYMYRYSERQGTYAAKKMADDVPDEIKQDRLERLIRFQTAISQQNNAAEQGRVHRILVEGRSKRSALEQSGRTATGKMCVFKPESEEPTLGGKEVDVRITDSTSATLRGQEICQK